MRTLSLLLLTLAACTKTPEDPGDTTAPRVESTSPVTGAVDVGLTATVSVTFDEAMDAATLSSATFEVADGDGDVPGTVTYDPDTLTAAFAPTDAFRTLEVHTATIDGGVTDVAGNPMGVDYAFTFTTEVGMASVAPVLEYTVRDLPKDGTPDVFVGDGPPDGKAMLVKAGTEDRALMQFALADLPEELVSVDLVFTMDTIDPDGPVGHLSLHSWQATGTAALADFSAGTVLEASFDGPNTNDREEYSWDVADVVEAARTASASHVGFRITGLDIERYNVMSTLDAVDADHPRLEVAY